MLRTSLETGRARPARSWRKESHAVEFEINAETGHTVGDSWPSRMISMTNWQHFGQSLLPRNSRHCCSEIEMVCPHFWQKSFPTVTSGSEAGIALMDHIDFSLSKSLDCRMAERRLQQRTGRAIGPRLDYRARESASGSVRSGDGRQAPRDSSEHLARHAERLDGRDSPFAVALALGDHAPEGVHATLSAGRLRRIGQTCAVDHANDKISPVR
jgi:hypothetical protein